MPSKLYKINSLQDLNEFAIVLSGGLRGGSVVAMKGELGSGKTTLVQMVAQILKLKTSITSPTFNILKLYSIPTTSQKKYKAKQLCHIDLYRLHSVDKTIGFSEYLGNEDFICFVEWSEKITKQLPKNTVILSISVNGTQRTIKKQD